MYQQQHWHQSRGRNYYSPLFSHLLPVLLPPLFCQPLGHGLRTQKLSDLDQKSVLRALTRSLCLSPLLGGTMLVPNSLGATSSDATSPSHQAHLPSCGFLTRGYGRWRVGEVGVKDAGSTEPHMLALCQAGIHTFLPLGCCNFHAQGSRC